MNRRRFLRITGSAVIVPTVAGCTSDEGSGASNSNGNGESDSTPAEGQGTTLTDIVEITDHDWRGATILEVTVENKTADTLDLVQVEADLFIGNERINHSYTNISSLPGETVETSEIQFSNYDQDPCNADRYDLVPNFYYENEDYEERFEHEFNPEFCEE